MVCRRPHFLLFSDAERTKSSAGRWRFLLESIRGDTVVEASDVEPGVRGERLELLAVVRGLEALDQPSRVTLVTPSRHVSRGLRFGLDEWRRNGWCWERHGRQVPVKNCDLWQRIDRALEFHRVDCRTWRLDAAHQTATCSMRATRSRSERWRRPVQCLVHMVQRLAAPGAWGSRIALNRPLA